ERHVRDRRACIFGIAAVDGAPEAAHQRSHLRADRKLAARAGLHHADALDTADRRGFGPLAAAHVELRMIKPERLDLDDDMTRSRLGLGNVLVDQAVEPAEFLEDDGLHGYSPGDRPRWPDVAGWRGIAKGNGRGRREWPPRSRRHAS